MEATKKFAGGMFGFGALGVERSPGVLNEFPSAKWFFRLSGGLPLLEIGANGDVVSDFGDSDFGALRLSAVEKVTVFGS